MGSQGSYVLVSILLFVAGVVAIVLMAGTFLPAVGLNGNAIAESEIARSSFAPPWDVFIPGQEPFLTVSDPVLGSDGKARFTVSIDRPGALIHPRFYVKGTGRWEAFSFGSRWSRDEVSKTIVFEKDDLSDRNYVLAYTCKRNPKIPGGWDCGCKSQTDSSCRRYAMQSFPGASDPYPWNAGDYSRSFWHGGEKRSYEVRIPKSPRYDMPVLLAMHGGGGNIERMRDISGLDATADEEGFIVVYPMGAARLIAPNIGSWNAGECCGWAKRKGVDDVGFLAKVIDEVIEEFEADESRVYATGMSNGAQMSYRLACERADKLAGIAPVAGHSVFDSCNPTSPVPVIHFHGKKDDCQSYNGAESCGGCLSEYFQETLGFNLSEDEYSCESIPRLSWRWRIMNGARDGPKTIYRDDDTTCTRYDGKAPVALCISASGGHTWPGTPFADQCGDISDCELMASIVGDVAPVDWNSIMWDFLSEQRR